MSKVPRLRRLGSMLNAGCAGWVVELFREDGLCGWDEALRDEFGDGVFGFYF